MNKRRIIKFIFVLIGLCVLVLKSGSQDIHFSQFFEAPLVRNPSLAGIYKGDIRYKLFIVINGILSLMHIKPVH
jgi:hypothetical protein